VTIRNAKLVIFEDLRRWIKGRSKRERAQDPAFREPRVKSKDLFFEELMPTI